MSILNKIKWRWDGNDGEPRLDVSRRRFLFMGGAAALVAVVAPKLIIPSESEQYLTRAMQAVFAFGGNPNVFSSYEAVGVREGLSDVIHDISSPYVRRNLKVA